MKTVGICKLASDAPASEIAKVFSIIQELNPVL